MELSLPTAIVFASICFVFGCAFLGLQRMKLINQLEKFNENTKHFRNLAEKIVVHTLGQGYLSEDEKPVIYLMHEADISGDHSPHKKLKAV